MLYGEAGGDYSAAKDERQILELTFPIFLASVKKIKIK
jgi:hypothetical protein